MSFILKEDVIKVLAAGGGGFSVMMTNIELLLKVLIGVATLMYLGVKIHKELKSRNTKR